MSRTIPILVFLLAQGVSTFGADLKDPDTLAQERARFPLAFETIVGKYARPSPALVASQIDKLTRQVKAEPKNGSPYGALARAQAAAGQLDEAIATMLKKEEIDPGQYETYAQCGAYYFLTRDLEKSRYYLAKAVAIDATAHQGRDLYFKHFVDYAIERLEEAPDVVPLRKREGEYPGLVGYVAHLEKGMNKSPWTLADSQAGVRAMNEVLRSVSDSDPMLLEALGDLLCERSFDFNDGGRHAALAYVKAANNFPDALDVKRIDYHKLARSAVREYPQWQLAPYENDLRREIIEAKRWFQKIADEQKEWVSSGEDIQLALAKQRERVDGEAMREIRTVSSTETIFWYLSTAIFAGVAVAVAVILYRFAKRLIATLFPEPVRE